MPPTRGSVKKKKTNVAKEPECTGSVSPTRATAVKFLQASPENPFATNNGNRSDDEMDCVPSRFDSAR